MKMLQKKGVNIHVAFYLEAQLFFSIWIFFHEHSRIIGQKGGGEAICLSLPLPPASQTLRYQPGDYSRELISGYSQLQDANREYLVPESLTIKLCELKLALLVLISYYICISFFGSMPPYLVVCARIVLFPIVWSFQREYRLCFVKVEFKSINTFNIQTQIFPNFLYPLLRFMKCFQFVKGAFIITGVSSKAVILIIFHFYPLQFYSKSIKQGLSN